MRIFITGASGFVGNHIIRILINAGHIARCLVHARTPYSDSAGIELFQGDILDPKTLLAGVTGCDAIIHLVGIIRPKPKHGITFERLHVEASKNVIQAAQLAGVKRYLHMSANGADQNNTSADYLRTKGEAEELVRNSGLDWSIFRPSLIVGSGGEFTAMLRQQVQFLPTIPVIGSGKYMLMPVAIEDIAQGFVKALTIKGSTGQTYQCCGPDRCSYDGLIDIFANTMGKDKVRKMHVPLSIMQPLTRIMERFTAYPITSEQITMLLSGNTCSDTDWYRQLELTPTPLADSIKKALGK